MKRMLKFIIPIINLLFLPCFTAMALPEGEGNRMVILHTNDTHSNILPASDGLGGVARRQVVIDSIRNEYPDVLLVDAGDAVQGTLFFTLFEGKVESRLMNELGYDIQILGNHEFDSGMDALVDYASSLKAAKISTNYDFTETPLDSIFRPYLIHQSGGNKIGFIAINLNPEGIIYAGNSGATKYLDGIKAANATAWHLKHNEKVDKVVVITHIGYKLPTDYSDFQLAQESEDIDLIIGGHTHTLIDPNDTTSVPSRITNRLGEEVIIAQAGYGGKNIGEVIIDFDRDTIVTSIIPIDSRLDSRVKPETADIIESYTRGVDSLMNVKISRCETDLTKGDWTLVNLIADMIKTEGERLTGKPVDLAIMNKGGIRCHIPKGNISEGVVMQMLPFNNKIFVLELSGRSLLEAFAVMSSRGGEGVSRGVVIPIDRETGNYIKAELFGKPIDPEKTYLVATLDYLATGGDYMTPLEDGIVVAQSENKLYKDILRQLSANYKSKGVVKADREVRMPLIDKRK